MKNVTITLDEETASWARLQAVRAGLSLSRLIGDLLRRQSRELGAYERAMHRFLQREPVRLQRRGVKYPTREQLHDRAGIR